MLVLTRTVNQKIVVEGGIEITIMSVKGHKVRIGIEAPPNVKVLRSELLEKAKHEDEK